MAKKKLKWTYELLLNMDKKDIRKLSDLELARGLNRLYSTVNKRIEGLKKLDSEEGYYIDAIYDNSGKYIRKFTSGEEGTRNFKVNELLRMRHFLSLKSASIQGVKELGKENKERLRRTLKYYDFKEEILNGLNNKALSRIYKMFRYLKEYDKGWYNEQRLGQLAFAYRIGVFDNVNWTDNDSIASAMQKIYGSDLTREMKLSELQERYTSGLSLKASRSKWLDFMEDLEDDEG